MRLCSLAGQASLLLASLASARAACTKLPEHPNPLNCNNHSEFICESLNCDFVECEGFSPAPAPDPDDYCVPGCKVDKDYDVKSCEDLDDYLCDMVHACKVVPDASAPEVVPMPPPEAPAIAATAEPPIQQQQVAPSPEAQPIVRSPTAAPVAQPVEGVRQTAQFLRAQLHFCAAAPSMTLSATKCSLLKDYFRVPRPSASM